MDAILKQFPKLGTLFLSLNEKDRECLKASFGQKTFEQWEFYRQCLDLKNFVGDEDVGAPECFSLEDRERKRADWEKAQALGFDYVKSGKVAALTVAGGLGTRLGFPGPKGLVGVTPVKGKPLFQVFSEKLQAIQRQYGVYLHWFIMTSAETHEATIQAFQKNQWYPKSHTHFFQQGYLPGFDNDGLPLLKDACHIQYFPDGHGGVLHALKEHRCLELMRELGVETISYFQVDNPLVHIADLGFLGLHLMRRSDFSTKVVLKRSATEKVGVFALKSTGLSLLEYSELSDELRYACEADQRLRFRYGNTAIHLLERKFLESCSAKQLPIHIHRKPIATWDPKLQINILENQAYKLEYFIFDLLAYAKNPLLLEVDRNEEFSPVKNDQGDDSLKTCIQAQVDRACRWLISNGVSFPVDLVDKNGHYKICVEVSPLFADDAINFQKAWKALVNKPHIEEGTYLEG